MPLFWESPLFAKYAVWITIIIIIAVVAYVVKWYKSRPNRRWSETERERLQRVADSPVQHNRGSCSMCDGTGVFYNDLRQERQPCPRCKGTGTPELDDE